MSDQNLLTSSIGVLARMSAAGVETPGGPHHLLQSRNQSQTDVLLEGPILLGSLLRLLLLQECRER